MEIENIKQLLPTCAGCPVSNASQVPNYFEFSPHRGDPLSPGLTHPSDALRACREMPKCQLETQRESLESILATQKERTITLNRLAEALESTGQLPARNIPFILSNIGNP